MVPAGSRRLAARSIRRQATAGLALTIAIAVVVATAGAVATAIAAGQASAVQSTLLPATANANALLTAMVDAETGVRGYLLTGDEVFLQPYEAAVAGVPRLEHDLAVELAGRPHLLADLAAARARYGTWDRTYAQPSIAGRAAASSDAPTVVAQALRGKHLFDLIRASMATLFAGLERADVAGVTSLSDVDDTTIGLLVGGCLVAAIGGVVARRRVRSAIVAPVLHLQHEVQLVASGDAAHRIAASGPDELLDLGRGVEEMRLRVLELGRSLEDTARAAETLQRSLLPLGDGVTGAFEWSVRYVAGSGEGVVGGDWYNLAADDRVARIVVGDVAGHGLAAAVAMARLRFAIEAYQAQGFEPEAILGQLSEHHGAALGDLPFATALACLLDAPLGELRVASAGHLPPVLLRSGEATVVDGLEAAPPLGLPHEGYRSTSIAVHAGDVLVAFTDGLVERRTASLDEGYCRLLTVLEAAPTELPALGDAVMAEMAGSGDDALLLAARFG